MEIRFTGYLVSLSPILVFIFKIYFQKSTHMYTHTLMHTRCTVLWRAKSLPWGRW